MLKKLILFSAAAALIMLLTACSSSAFSVEYYMRPPAASGYSAEIQQLLNEEIGTEFNLRYPRSGEHRSAVVLYDIDNDAIDEAVVFYRLSTESSGAHMIVLDCNAHGEWRIAGGSSGGGEIDRVLFGDLNGDGSNEIITGWNGHSDGCTIYVHSLTDGILQSISIATGEQDDHPADQYSEMAVGDFDSDLRDDIITVYRNPSDGTAVARLLRLGYGADGTAIMRTADRTETDGSVYQYINAQAGYTGMGSFGMVLDGCRGTGCYVTETIYWDAKTQSLTSSHSDGSNSVTPIFNRSTSIISQDIDGDGMLEMPSDRLLAGYSSSSESPIFLTSWYNFNNSEATLAMQAIMCMDQGYYFCFPTGWDSRITAQSESPESMVFFLYENSADFSDELFRIVILTKDEWNKHRDSLADTLLQTGSGQSDYLLLAQTDYYVYAALISPASEAIGITDELLATCFHLTS